MAAPVSIELLEYSELFKLCFLAEAGGDRVNDWYFKLYPYLKTINFKMSNVRWGKMPKTSTLGEVIMGLDMDNDIPLNLPIIWGIWSWNNKKNKCCGNSFRLNFYDYGFGFLRFFLPFFETLKLNSPLQAINFNFSTKPS